MKLTEKDSSSVVTNFSPFMETRESALFTHLPIPPSSNNQYFLARRGKKTYHVASKDLKTFQAAMTEYPLLHSNNYLMNRHKVQGWIKNRTPLEIRSLFFFHRSRVLTQDNRPKKMDCSNRIKALHDSLARILEVDDCWFFRVMAEKAITTGDLPEMCYVEILPIL